jgi:ferredoxin
MSALADGSGGMDALDAARRAASVVRGRGACSHPDGTSRFVLSALDVFTDDLAAHLFRGSCGQPVRGVLPLSPEDDEARLQVDWTRCQGHGLCRSVVPELVQLDNQGFPVFLDMPVPFWLEKEAQQAVAMCPALALRLTPSVPESGAGKTPRAAVGSSPAPPTLQLVIPPRRELPRA